MKAARQSGAGLRAEDIVDQPDVLADPSDPNSAALPCRSLRLGRIKTAGASDGTRADPAGKPVLALEAWLKDCKIAAGPVFREGGR